MNQNKKTAVIGAGISGLTTAYWLQKAGRDVHVYERDEHIGGSIITENEDGFLMDLGPNSALETSEVLKDLIRELGIEEQKIYGNEASNNRYIVRSGKLHALPMSPVKFLMTPLFSFGAKLRLLREPFLKPTDGGDISLADFVRYRLGEEFLTYAINPFVAGVYAGDPDNLSTAAAFPKLYALEQNYGSFIRGAIKGKRERKKRQEVAKDRARLFSFKEGMALFPQTLAAKLKHSVNTGHEVKEIEKDSDNLRLILENDGVEQTESFDEVVVSIPTYRMASVLKKLAPQVVSSIKKVQYPPVNVVFMGFHRDDVQRDLDGFGFLIPKAENRQILGSIWSSSIFPGRAPGDHVAFTTFVGGTRQPEVTELNDQELSALVQNELDDFVGISGDPVKVRIKRWSKAIPQYTMGYHNVQRIFDELEENVPGLYFAGNYRRGISVGDSVLSAHETAQKMLQSKP